MPPSASRRPSADFCHSAHNDWNRCCATPAQSLPSGARSEPVSERNSPSMLAEPELTRDDRLASCSGVTRSAAHADLLIPSRHPVARLATKSRSDVDVLAFVVHRATDRRKRVATEAGGRRRWTEPKTEGGL